MEPAIRCEHCGRELKISNSNNNKGNPVTCVCRRREYQREYMRERYGKPDSSINRYQAEYYAENRELIAVKRKARRRGELPPRQRPERTNEHDREIRRTQAAKWQAANPDKVAAIARKYRYGISKDEYHALLAAQNGLCYLCGIKPKRPHLDHCHKTGVIRKFLCGPCNCIVGKIEANPSWLDRMKTYL